MTPARYPGGVEDRPQGGFFSVTRSAASSTGLQQGSSVPAWSGDSAGESTGDVPRGPNGPPPEAESRRGGDRSGAAAPAPDRRRGGGGPRVAWLVPLLAAGVFAVDLVTPGVIAAAVLYVGAVLVALGTRRPRVVVSTAVLCTLLTLIGAVLPPVTAPLWQVVANRALALAALWAVALSGISRQRAQGRLREQQEWFSTILGSIGDAVIATDVGGRVVFYNREAETIVGRPAEEALGRPLAEVLTLIDEQTREPAADPVAQVLERGRTAGFAERTLLVGAGGAEVPIADSGAPIRDAEGRLLGVVMVLQDIGERAAAERATRFVAEVGSGLVGAAESERALSDGLRAVTEYFDAGYAALAAGASPAAAAIDCEPGMERPGDLPWSALDAPARDRFATGLPVLVGDARTDPATAEAFDETFRPLRWRSLAVVPLGNGGDALWLAARLPRTWGAADGRLLRSVADLLALAWESCRTMVALRRAQRSRDEYLAMLAHELRGPMAPMRTDLSMLARQIDPLSEAERLRGRVERQLGQLARLTDGLLEVARLTQGKVRLRREAVDLRRVVEGAVEGCRSTLAERRQELAVRLPDDPVVVDGDAARLEQVVVNLLANASKYTPEGGHAWVALTAGDGEAVLAVRDDGIGITREFLPHAFEPFTQSERGADRAAGGLGLGLALVRRVSELHGGRVEADSAGTGQGATFTIRLPVRRNGEAVDDDGSGPVTALTAPLKVLVVDDSRDTRESLAEWLRLQGHEVMTAAHADEARSLARETRPDVALLDIGLPGIDGYQLARLLREDLREIRVIATSGYGQPEALERSREAGFDLHLVKPLDLRALRDALASS